MGIRSTLSNDLRLTLNSKRITLLSHASKTQDQLNCTDRWKSSADLGLADVLATEWSNFIKALCGEGITLSAFNKDELKWAGGDRSGAFTVSNCYDAIISTRSLSIWSGWKIECWKWFTQLKIILFFLLAAENKVLTWDVLLKKG